MIDISTFKRVIIISSRHEVSMETFLFKGNGKTEGVSKISVFQIQKQS